MSAARPLPSAHLNPADGVITGAEICAGHDTTAELPCTFDYACVSPALAQRVRSVRADTAATGSDHQPLLLELA